MAACCEAILTFTTRGGFAEFTSHGVVYGAVLRNLSVLGEAARNMPDRVRAQYPQIEWRGEATPESDIDVLVRFSQPPGFDGHMDLKFYPVDLFSHAGPS
jgi:hypothetical protein